MRYALAIDRYWDGEMLPPSSRARIELASTPAGDLQIHVDAPFFGDPAPEASPGSMDGLWEYEVVELFIAGPTRRYLEVELGPHGHYLVLSLSDVRVRARAGLTIEYRASIDGGARFRGLAVIPADYLPPGPWHANAYAIHARNCRGAGGRCHHAHAPVPGASPDFHQPQHFVPLPGE